MSHFQARTGGTRWLAWAPGLGRTGVRRRCWACIGALCLVWMGASPGVRAQTPVEGDATLLRLLQDRQETNRTLFRTGEMDVTAEQRVEGIRVQAHVVWQGEKTYWDYVYTSPVTIPRPQGPETTMTTRRQRMIEVPGTVMWYTPAIALAHNDFSERPGSRVPAMLELRPDQGWFRMDGVYGSARGHHWRTLFDPNHDSEYLSRFVVQPASGERVVVEHHYKSGSLLRIEASLAHSANVIAYEAVPRAHEPERPDHYPLLWNKGRYEWAQDADGNWYPTHFDFRRGQGEELHYDYSLDITSFNPHPQIPRDRFQFASLALAPGTKVQETGKDGATTRTYRLGQDGKEERPLDQAVLDDLAERLREGFAAPDRDRK